jgi:hypothetical protein
LKRLDDFQPEPYARVFVDRPLCGYPKLFGGGLTLIRYTNPLGNLNHFASRLYVPHLGQG